MIYKLLDLQQRQRTVRNVTIRRTQLNIGIFVNANILYCLGDPVNKNTFTNVKMFTS